MRKTKGIGGKISLRSIILCLMRGYVPTILASNGGVKYIRRKAVVVA